MPGAVLKNHRAYYVYADHLNSPRAITDRKGQVVWRWDSDPFGVGQAVAPIKSTEDSDDADEDADHDGKAFVYNLRFPGQYYDQETGLHYNTFRDYDPATGRYIQSDWIGLAGGINIYTYVGNNPVNLTDPSGNCPWCIPLAIMALEAWNAYDTASDVVDTAKVLGNQCSSNNDKLRAVGLLALGVIDPTPGNLGKKGLNKLARYDGPKPTCFENPAHIPGMRGFNPAKTPLPKDAEAAFAKAVPNVP